MECEEFSRLRNMLGELFEVLSRTLPVAHIHEHPFAYHAKRMEGIFAVIGQIAEQALEEEQSLALENEQQVEKMLLYCSQLGIPGPEVKQLANVHLQREFIDNEMKRVAVLRGQVQSEIGGLEEEMRRVREWMGLQPAAEIERDVSMAVVSMLRLELDELNAEKARREAQRQGFYDRIKEICSELERDCALAYDESIGALEQTVERLESELLRCKSDYERISGEIAKREACLGMPPRAFERCYSSESMREMEAYNDHLRAEQTRLFDSIFSRVRDELSEISAIFGLAAESYPATEEALGLMRDKIAELLPKKDLFCEIVALIERRRLLLQKMTEFEKIASDPKRLFKSSFQLNSEEKFRNTAYPSLLKLEESIFEQIDAYEKNFSGFVYNSEKYRVVLRAEIDNRIINRTVFISRCDSPYRKRK
ncbi:hypothetical protein PAPHI01_0885 [Pancytospora philotis]|nr:hypothetical protein PAPHI01_0885 [Pancytospora philotis]